MALNRSDPVNSSSVQMTPLTRDNKKKLLRVWFINQGSSDVHSLEFENEAVEAGQQHLSDKPEDASQNKATRHFTLVPVHFILRCFPVQSLRNNVSEISFFFSFIIL